MIIATWNVNGIRARSQEVIAWHGRVQPDVVCLQEIKAAPEQIEDLLFLFPDYHSFWHGKKGGYSGVSLHLKKSTFPEVEFSHPPFDHETRIVEARAGKTTFASVYVPNGGKDYPAKVEFLRALTQHVADTRAKGQAVVLCGDLNVARAPMDVHPSQRDDTVIGQLPEERRLFEGMLSAGLVDASRSLYPDDDHMYSWWPYWRNARQRNLGWRLDYVLASPELRVVTSVIERETGKSDHAPLLVELADESADSPQK